MSAFLLPDAVPPLRAMPDGGAWTVWDARSVPVLRTPQGRRTVPTRAEAEALLPGGAPPPPSGAQP